MNKKKVLFVDDEPNVLKALMRALHPLRQEFEMVFIASGKAALESMAESPAYVVVADMRMPLMGGHELLQRVRSEYPGVVRIALTGQPDSEIWRETIAISHYFLWKPVDGHVLKNLLLRIAQLDRLLTCDKLAGVLGNIRSLPSLPDLFFRLTAMLDNPDCDAEDIAGVLGSDMSMALQVLKMVNCAACYGGMRRIDTLPDAVTYLGLDMIRSLVLARHLFTVTENRGMSSSALATLWAHSLSTAGLAAAIVARQKARLAQSTAFLGGLMHDVGKLILAHCLPEEDRAVKALIKEKGWPIDVAEREILGADHTALGGYLTQLWGLPRPIVEAVALHHISTPFADPGPVGEQGAVWHANRLSRGDTSHSGQYSDLIGDFRLRGPS